MKKFLLVAVAALAVVACKKDEDEPVNPNGGNGGTQTEQPTPVPAGFVKTIQKAGNNGSYTYTETTTYTVAGGNLIKKIERGQTTEYKYDSNINPRPLNALMKAAAPDYFLKENYSKNNLIEQVDSYTDLQGNLVKNIASIELTYNSKGYPTMKKFFRQRGSNVKTLQYIEEIEY